MRVVDAAALRRALPMNVAIDALRTAFAREDPSLASPMRTTLASRFSKPFSTHASRNDCSRAATRRAVSA